MDYSSTDSNHWIPVRGLDDFETVLQSIADQFGIPGNLSLTKTILKMQATINGLEANQKLMQSRITELEGAQELP